MHTSIIIPITTSYPRNLTGNPISHTIAASIHSLIGTEPKCRFGENYIEVTFTNNQFNQIKKDYGRKWRSNITHEIKRQCRFEGLTPRLKELSITKQ